MMCMGPWGSRPPRRAAGCTNHALAETMIWERMSGARRKRSPRGSNNTQLSGALQHSENKKQLSVTIIQSCLSPHPSSQRVCNKHLTLSVTSKQLRVTRKQLERRRSHK
eukprot:scaffold1215_cov99-Phaeocystis_antarctica.AAC.3